MKIDDAAYLCALLSEFNKAHEDVSLKNAFNHVWSKTTHDNAFSIIEFCRLINGFRDEIRKRNSDSPA